MEVATVFADLWQVGFPVIPQISHVATVAKVSWKYAAKVVDEISITGDFIDPDIQKVEQNLAREQGEFLSQEEEVFLLSLRAEDATRPLLDYVQILEEHYGTRHPLCVYHVG
jgi:methionine salvage enolase-phosphatase E1